MNMAIASNVKEFNSVIEKLSQMSVVIEDIVKNFEETIRLKSSENGFSILEHVCHLRDLEQEGYLVRIRRLLTESKPYLPGFDGDKIALEREYNKQDALTALTDFKKARQQSVETLKGLTTEQLKSAGELEGVGPITLENLICLMLGHDEAHRNELTELTNELSKKQ
jgi:hypothetical protein